MSYEDRIAGLIRDGAGIAESMESLEKLHGDASYRAYYRASLEGGRTLIIMQMPEGKASASEEITNFNGTHKELPFLNVTRYLSSRGLPVPEVLHYGESEHALVIEDLGDDLLFREVDGAGRGKRLDWYGRAIDLLVTMQEKTIGGTAEDCIAFARSFDAYLLNWEFRHFLEFGIEARSEAPMDAADLDIFEKVTQGISSAIQRIGYCFTHRDFQSRNLIIDDGRLHMIDYQDALMGPQVYDLVALLRDSYVKLPDDMVDELEVYYGE